MVNPPTVEHYESSDGARIYQMPLEAFPGLRTYAYLVLFNEYQVLIDSGSGFGNSNVGLDEGFRRVKEHWLEETARFEDLTHILITHGHIDHIGGLNYLRPRSQAQLGIHELDRRNITNYEERLTVVARNLQRYLIEAGVSKDRVEDLLSLYKITKALFHSEKVDFTYEAIRMQMGPFEFLHVPGHCAGHVVIRLHDVLFSGDHILDDITPHQAPEHLTLSTGLEHYLHSLDLLNQWGESIRLTLGGHKKPIRDLSARISEIQQAHVTRLDQVMDFFKAPNTINACSDSLFGNVHGYNTLLALEETGAHVEYLYERGLLGIDNFTDYENSDGPVPILYKRIG
jgi:glyoxylase-like metal-dependent hydrolase (beta-lactamase superfamily II)